MGIRLSFPGARTDNLIFPIEVVEDILKNLSVRDKLIARQVCTEWLGVVDDSLSICMENIVMKCEDTEECIRYFSNSSADIIWTQFRFQAIPVTRYSFSFWENYGDQITYLDFFDCTFPPNAAAGNGEEDAVKYCKNLKHFRLRNCSKYLMMGKMYFNLHRLFQLENLQSLDLSNNEYLNDFALLTFVTSTKRLESLNLSDSKIAFTRAVFNRFYPRVAQGEVPAENFGDFSDNVLTFHMLNFAYLGTPLASSMTELILNGTRVDRKALQLISNPGLYKWTSISLNNCPEIRATDITDFLAIQSQITKLEIESSKLEVHNLCQKGVDISKYEHLVISKNGEISSLDFLTLMPNLQYLDVSSCANLRLKTESFSNSQKLKVLKMRSIIPFYDMNRNNTILAENIACCLATLPQLVELDLGFFGSAFTDIVMQAIIKNMPNLITLKVCQSRITDRGVAGTELDDFDSRLSPSTVMRRRANILERNSMSDRGFCLSRLVYLRTLSFSTCRDLSEATWKLALRLPNLVALDLSFCGQISASGFSAVISNCPNLETLNILQCGLHITGSQELLDDAKFKLRRLRNLII